MLDKNCFKTQFCYAKIYKFTTKESKLKVLENSDCEAQFSGG